MAKMQAKVATRLSTALKRFQPILSSAKARDVNESDTVLIITDLLSEMFGFDKYSEITSEHVIRGTYCDLALTIESKVKLLVEVKAIGLDLKEAHIKQAVDYAANKGVDWVVLTNGTLWQIYKVSFGKPIGQDLVAEIDLLRLNHRVQADIQMLYLLSREGITEAALKDFHIQRQATNRFLLGQLLLSDAITQMLRRELKKIYPEIKVQADEIHDTLALEVLKREVVEGEDAIEAAKIIKKSAAKRKPQPKALKENDTQSTETPEEDLVKGLIEPVRETSHTMPADREEDAET